MILWFPNLNLFHKQRKCRSQWPRGLRHETHSPSQTLGSWVRIQLETWMSARVSSVSVLSYVLAAALWRSWSPAQGVLPTVYKIHTSRLILVGNRPKGLTRKADLLTYRAEAFLRNCQLCCYSRTSQHFKTPESSLPCSQESSAGPYPESDRSSPYHLILFL
jgi:hypothetical protein